MSLANAEVIRSTKNAVVRRQFYFIAYSVMQIGDVADLKHIPPPPNSTPEQIKIFEKYREEQLNEIRRSVQTCV
jgi:hypothetical protein